jgi:hypothetical protein
MRKVTSLVLVFTILFLSGNMFAQGRKGADLIVQRTDGIQARGELIAVKQGSLLLLERDSGTDVSVNIDDIKVISIVKKREYGKGFFSGFTMGALSGAGFAGYMMANPIFGEPEFLLGPFIGTALISGLVAGVLGLLVTSLSSNAKLIQFEGKSDSEIKEILEKLRKKARIKNAR